MRLLPLVIVGFITYTLAAATDVNSQAAPLKQRLAEKGGNIINYNSNVPKDQLSQTQGGIMDKATVVSADSAKAAGKVAGNVAGGQNIEQPIIAPTTVRKAVDA